MWSGEFSSNAIEALTASLDWYQLEIDDAVAGRVPGDVITACVLTLDPLFCDLTPRTSSGALDVIDNQLQNIGGIEASGFDVSVGYTGPEWSWGQVNAKLDATFLTKYEETTANIDGTSTVTDRKGTHTNETFQRAFPELRTVTSFDWIKDRWNGTLSFRWTDEMQLDGGTKVDSAMFTDLRVAYRPDIWNDGLTIALGFNNVLDEDPPVCFPCGVIGMSTVSHDLPGRVGYLRVTYRQE